MKSSLRPFGWLITFALCACFGGSLSCGALQSNSFASPPKDGAAARPSKDAPGPPAPMTEVAIPGPLRSFLRMAGISQQVSAAELMPMIARKAYLQGYVQGRPSEFLLLIQRLHTDPLATP